MANSFQEKSKTFKRFLLMVMLAVLFLLPVISAKAQDKIPQVLILHSYNPTYSWTKDMQKGIENALGSTAQLFVIHLDANQIDLEKNEDLFCEMLRRLGMSRFEVVVCTDDPALNFVLKYQKDIFKSVPIVFCGANNFNPDRIADLKNITGVNEEISLEDNLALITSVRPSLKRLAVIGDLTITGQRNLKLFRRMMGKKSCGFEILFFDNHNPDKLIQALKQLEPEDAVLYLSYLKPPEGKTLTIEESCRLILGASPAPVFGCWDFLTGTGFLGGKVACAYNQGKTAALIVGKILAGTPVSQVPVQMKSPNQFVFDYNALSRHKIDFSRLPSDSEIINMPEQNWLSYWPWFLGGIVILVVETILIFSLIRSKSSLLSEEARHQAMLANIADVIAIIDAQGFNRFKSANVEKLFGWKPEDLIGQSTWKLVHPDDQQATQKVFAELLADPSLQKTSLCRYLCKNGEYKWIEFTAANHLNNKIINGILLNYHDVTARIESEKEQKKLEQQLQQTQRLESLGVLAGGIAHDFNNLLMTIQGYSELTEADLPPGSHVNRFLNEIKKATHRAADLCRQMLAYSGRANFIKENVDLHKTVKDMTELLQASVTKKSRLFLEASGAAPIIEADVTQINQIIMNLVINASESINHSDGEVRVSTSIVECDAELLRSQYIDQELPSGQYARLEVSDNGCGMTEETLKKLFDPFFTTKFTGRGLGMSAVLGIVKSHRGTLKVDSKPGHGSCFQIFFPLLKNGSAETDRVIETHGVLIPNGSLVMIVDDEESVRRVVEKMLEILGLKVISASDGVEAVELFRQHQDSVELVLLDLTMPRKDGYETLVELRSLKPDLRIIVASGYGEHELQKRFGTASRLGFINKPYSMELIKTELSKLFRAS